jgi:hypothetical protein
MIHASTGEKDGYQRVSEMISREIPLVFCRLYEHHHLPKISFVARAELLKQ